MGTTQPQPVTIIVHCQEMLVNVHNDKHEILYSYDCQSIITVMNVWMYVLHA